MRADTYFAVAALEDHIASIDDALNDARLRGGTAEVARLERTRAELLDSYAQCALRRNGERQLLMVCRRLFMKQLMLVCLLAASAARRSSAAARRGGKAASRDVETCDDAKREADEAKTRAKLDEARARLDKAAREVAELSTQLGANARRRRACSSRGGPSQAVLGVQVDPRSDEKGARVLQREPGRPGRRSGPARRRRHRRARWRGDHRQRIPTAR